MMNQPMKANSRASIKALEEQERDAYLKGNTEKADLIKELIKYKKRVHELEEELLRLTHNYN